MEEWLDFADAFSPHLLRGLPWGNTPDEVRVRTVFEESWALLRQGVLYFMRFQEGQHTDEQITDAQKCLLQYGRLAEEVRHPAEGRHCTGCPLLAPCLRLPPMCIAPHSMVVVQVLGGAALVTFKLHLAACHLPDQVRVGGAAYFSLEFWVERMVQEYKGYIRGRGTGKPELLYVKDEVMSRACRRMRRERRGRGLQLIREAVEEAKVRRRPRAKRTLLPRVMGEPCPELVGAPRPLTEVQRAFLLPDYRGHGDLGGLGYILQNAPELGRESGWPTFADVPDDSERHGRIAQALGLSSGGDPGDPAAVVHFRKFSRAVLSSGDCVCSAEYQGQVVKDDTWCLIRYMETGADGVTLPVWYVAHIQILAQAVLASMGADDPPSPAQGQPGLGPTGEQAGAEAADGAVRSGSSDAADESDDARNGQDRHVLGARVGKPLAIAVGHLYVATAAAAPGVSVGDVNGARPPEFVYVPDVRPVTSASSPYAGTYAFLIQNIDTQLLPGPMLGQGRYFSTSTKSSGRVRRVDGKFTRNKLPDGAAYAAADFNGPL